MSDCRFGVSPVNYPDPEATFKLKSIIHGFAIKVRQTYRGEFNLV